MAAAGALALSGCGTDANDDPEPGVGGDAGVTAGEDTDGEGGQEGAADDDAEDGEQRYPDVVDAELEAAEDVWRLSATLSSPYDTPERYADAFRALTPDGEELGVRELLHDHADEQPFTRTLEQLEIPEGVEEIVVEGRDLEHGWGGETVTVRVPDR
jgi:hypothetical protein